MIKSYQFAFPRQDPDEVRAFVMVHLETCSMKKMCDAINKAHKLGIRTLSGMADFLLAGQAAGNAMPGGGGTSTD